MNNHDNLKISIITVCLNAAQTIENAIISVISQPYPNIEYIIIDGKSTDGTSDIINKYRDRISVYVSEKDEGIYDAMNKGIGLATGDFIYFLGSDDILYPKAISEVTERLDRNLNAIYYGNVILSPSGKWFGGKFSKWRLIHKNITHQSIFYPSIVLKEDMFNCKYKLFADWDLNLRLWSKHQNFIYIPVTIAKFHEGGRSYSLDSLFLKDQPRLIKKYFGILPITYFFLFISFPKKILNFLLS